MLKAMHSFVSPKLRYVLHKIMNRPYLKFPLNFEEQLHQLKMLESAAFDLWMQCFLNGEQAYSDAPEMNLSYGAHPGAAGFHHFINPFLKGNCLDIGCGPQISPSYLHTAMEKKDVRLFGIDPLYAEHPFTFYQGFAEFLPWQKNCFDVVICGTSLDHCLSLTKTLEEIKRVLKPGGKFLVWVGFISGAKVYNPSLSELQPVDQYHLFHFDRPWFEALIANYFHLIDSVNYDTQSCFYVFSNINFLSKDGYAVRN